jgi:hypothetical protein
VPVPLLPRRRSPTQTRTASDNLRRRFGLVRAFLSVGRHLPAVGRAVPFCASATTSIRRR